MSRRTGFLLVVVGSVFFASTGVMSKAAIDGGVAPLELASFRSYGAALILLPFLLASLRRLRRTDLVPVGLFALIGIVLAQGSYYESISRMDIAVTIVIVYTGPLAVAAYQRVFHGERLPAIGYAAMAVAIAGVALTVLGGSGGAGEISAVGVVFALVTAIAFAGQVILGARQPLTLPPLARTGAGMLAAALIWTAAVPFWSLPFDVLSHDTALGGRIDVTIPVGLAVAYGIVLGSVIPYAMVITGFGRIGAGSGSMAGMAEPIAAPLLAWFVLGQSLEPLQVAGIAVAVLGVAVVERQRAALAAGEIGVAEL